MHNLTSLACFQMHAVFQAQNIWKKSTATGSKNTPKDSCWILGGSPENGMREEKVTGRNRKDEWQREGATGKGKMEERIYSASSIEIVA